MWGEQKVGIFLPPTWQGRKEVLSLGEERRGLCGREPCRKRPKVACLMGMGGRPWDPTAQATVPEGKEGGGERDWKGPVPKPLAPRSALASRPQRHPYSCVRPKGGGSTQASRFALGCPQGKEASFGSRSLLSLEKKNGGATVEGRGQKELCFAPFPPGVFGEWG